MKKIILLLAAVSLSSSALFAQQRLNNSVMYEPQEQQYQQEPQGRVFKYDDIHSAHKTTTSPNTRWYDYVGYLNDENGGSTASASLYLWNDTLSTDIYSDGASGQVLNWNKMVSVGAVIDPYFGSATNTGFNNETYYPVATNMHMTPGYAYTVDSIEILGIYGINPAKTSVHDTITISYTTGAGTLTSTTAGVFQSYFTNSVVLTRYGLTTSDSLFFEDINYDSSVNKTNGANAHSQYFTISTDPTSLTNANWGDTLTGASDHGIFIRQIKLATPLSVSANGMAGIAISFKSGDASFVTNDTVYTGHNPGRYRYNMFRPLIGYLTTGASSTTPVFPVYSRYDHNVGLFKNLPNFLNGWKDRYVPTWAWSSTGGTPSTYQYPIISMHVSCPTCPTAVQQAPANTNYIHAYPNPATDELNISFNLYNDGNISVSLTDMVGQTVATQHMGSITSGKAVFNTAALPAGMYMYTVQGNGVRSAGHVVIAH